MIIEIMHKWHNILNELYALSFEGLIFGTTAAILAIIISPIQFLKIMRQETGNGYISILVNSYKKEGVHIFFRAVVSYAILNFISSASFGVSNYFSNLLLSRYSNKISFIVVSLFRALIGGLIETILTFATEIKEINKNKGIEKGREKSIYTIIFLIFLRNSIFWLGATIAFEIILNYSLKKQYVFWLTFFTGLISGIISTPIDRLATQICGSQNRVGIVSAWHKIFQDKKGNVFAGTLMRIIQIILYTILTEWVMQESVNWFKIVFAVV